MVCLCRKEYWLYFWSISSHSSLLCIYYGNFFLSHLWIIKLTLVMYIVGSLISLKYFLFSFFYKRRGFHNFFFFFFFFFFFLNCYFLHPSNPVIWGCKIYWLHFYRGIRSHLSMGILDMTLNYLIVRLQSWSFGGCGVSLHCYYSQVHSDPEQ